MEEDLSALNERVQAIHRCVVSEKSRAIYSGLSSRFLLWLLEANPLVLQPAFLNKLLQTPTDGRRTEILRCLSAAPLDPPLRFGTVTERDIELWIASLRKKDGTDPSKSYFASARSAVFDLYRMYHVWRAHSCRGASISSKE